ncbi:MAG TPA: hypothetical protein VMY59_10555 [Candidatus Thermoplasmatota archaeon]|nr:hypothetical protein [Candidatus Thermoplasmatota archaeon]
MRGSNIFVVGILLLLIVPVVSLPGSSQENVTPFWCPDYKGWSYRQELSLPIETNDTTVHCQPIDLRLRFEKPCWTENENNTSIRIACWYDEKWYDLESQIYSITKVTEEEDYISECNVIFLIPPYADGTEQYFIYYNNEKTVKPNYPDHVTIEDKNYTSAPLPEISAKAKFYGIIEDGYCIYGVGQEGQLLDRSCAQVVVKQKKNAKEFDIIDSDQIVSFAFSYYYGSKEKDESSSDQVFMDKKILIDGNLMVEFGIISESEKKDIQTTAIYRYYYCPLDEKRLNVHVKHEMLKDATVQGIDNVDGRFGSLISLKSRSAAVDSLNFGEIYPYLNFYSEKEKIEQYQLNQNPSTKDREWIISYKNDATLGTESWLCYGDGKKGIANAVIFASNQGIVTSGIDERDGIQLKVAEKQYVNFLGTEVDYVSINFGRHSYSPGYSHDVTIPSDLIVQFDAEVFSSETGGYEAVQKESYLYRTVIKSRTFSGDIPYEREQKRYNLTVISRFGRTLLSHPLLSNITGSGFPVMWIELHHEGRLIAEGAANRSLLTRAKKTFSGVLEGDYLVKVFYKWQNKKKIFTGSTIIDLNKDTKVNVFCTWERTFTFSFLDQNGQGIQGIHGWLTNKDGVLYDENITQNNGEIIVKAPFDIKDPYTFRAEYKDFPIYNEKLQQTIKKLNTQIILQLYNLNVLVTDTLEFPPGIEITPLLATSNGNKTIQLTPKEKSKGSFLFEDVPAGDYHLQISFGDFIDDIHVTIPYTGNTILMKFSAIFDLTIDLFDSKGNALTNDNVEFIIYRDNQTITKTKERTITLPPAHYTINAYLENELIGVKQFELINDKHLTFVTTIDSFFSVILPLLFYALFGFFVILTLLKKFSLSSLLKSLAILLVIFSFFQPWWLFTGSSSTIPAEKTTALYINPGMMIETKNYYGEVSLSIAEMPDIFLMLLAGMVPLALLACLCIGTGIVLKRITKKNYAFLLGVCGVILLSILLPLFYYGTTKLIEASIGSVQGEGIFAVTIGPEVVMMQSSWGFSSGFYIVCIAAIITVIALLLDIRMRFKQKNKLLSLRN